jgi:hypothetical protein
MLTSKPTITFQYHSKQVWFKANAEKHKFLSDVAKAYVKHYGSKYYGQPEPVGLSINIYDRKVDKSVYELNDKYSFRSTDILLITELIIEGLENVAYDTKRQVAEIFINKLTNPYQKVEFEVYKL